MMLGRYPNITGEFASSDVYPENGNGTLAFKTASRVASGNIRSGSNPTVFLITEFRASASDGMYGRATTNQPKSFQTLIIIKV